MKRILTFIFALQVSVSFAQRYTPAVAAVTPAVAQQYVSAGDNKETLERINVNENVSTHFIFSEPIQYVDISTNKVVGDLPITNVLRIKPIPRDSAGGHRYGDDLGIATIVGQKYLKQYQLVYSPEAEAVAKIKVSRSDGTGLLNPEITLSNEEMKEFAKEVLQVDRSYFSVKTQQHRFELKLNNVFTVGDYFFIDISAENNTNIKYDIDQIRFKIEDKKIVKATNFQAVEIIPEFQLYEITDFKKRYRNVFVFKKFTFPEEKVFTVEVAEDQISGRKVVLKVDYSDVLNADTL